MHLIDAKEGFLASHPLIAEGMAKFAELEFTGLRYNHFMDEDDMASLIYQGPSYLAGLYVRDITGIMDAGMRDIIQADFIDLLRPVYTDMVKDLHKKIKQVPMLRSMMSPFELRDKTRKGLLEYYRGLGAHRLASELEGQDLSRLLADV